MKNTICILPHGIACVALTQGKFAYLDEADAPLAAPYRWCAQRGRHTFYAMTIIPHPDGGFHLCSDGYSRRRLATPGMRRLLMGFTHGDPREVDHINRNGLDNRRLNLRMCLFDDGRNRANAGKNMTMNDRICSSPFKGVYLDRRSGKWKAQVQIGGRRKNLGRFAAPEDAARAYDAAALAEYGEFARINFPV